MCVVYIKQICIHLICASCIGRLLQPPTISQELDERKRIHSWIRSAARRGGHAGVDRNRHGSVSVVIATDLYLGGGERKRICLHKL